jgi:hypothetical protein
MRFQFSPESNHKALNQISGPLMTELNQHHKIPHDHRSSAVVSLHSRFKLIGFLFKFVIPWCARNILYIKHLSKRSDQGDKHP